MVPDQSNQSSPPARRMAQTRARSCKAAAAIVLSIAAMTAQAVTVVGGQSNIYLAGQGSSPSATLGTLPQQVAVTGGVTYTFSVDLSDTIQMGGSIGATGGDGAVLAGYPAPSPPTANTNGLYGPSVGNQVRYIAGVFLDSTAAGGTDPGSSLTFASLGFTSVAPALRQIFFVGDGRTGTASGILQQFIAPLGATKLFLGFIDMCNPGSIGCYSDNSGGIDVTVSAVPLPAAAWLFISALGALVTIGRRRRMHAAAA